MLQELASKWDLILACVVGFNLLMMGLHAALEKIKDLTSSDADNKLYIVVGQVIAFVQKLIDLAVGNKAHK